MQRVCNDLIHGMTYPSPGPWVDRRTFTLFTNSGIVNSIFQVIQYDNYYYSYWKEIIQNTFLLHWLSQYYSWQAVYQNRFFLVHYYMIIVSYLKSSSQTLVQQRTSCRSKQTFCARVNPAKIARQTSNICEWSGRGQQRGH